MNMSKQLLQFKKKIIKKCILFKALIPTYTLETVTKMYYVIIYVLFMSPLGTFFMIAMAIA